MVTGQPQRAAWCKSQILEISFCTLRPKERRVSLKKRRQQIHSSHTMDALIGPRWQCLLNGPCKNRLIWLNEYVKIFSVCMPREEVRRTMTTSERLAWGRGWQVSAEIHLILHTLSSLGHLLMGIHMRRKHLTILPISKKATHRSLHTHFIQFTIVFRGCSWPCKQPMGQSTLINTDPHLEAIS